MGLYDVSGKSHDGIKASLCSMLSNPLSWKARFRSEYWTDRADGQEVQEHHYDNVGRH